MSTRCQPYISNMQPAYIHGGRPRLPPVADGANGRRQSDGQNVHDGGRRQCEGEDEERGSTGSERLKEHRDDAEAKEQHVDEHDGEMLCAGQHGLEHLLHGAPAF